MRKYTKFIFGFFICVIVLSLWHLNHQTDKGKKIRTNIDYRMREIELSTPQAKVHSFPEGKIIVLDIPYQNSLIPELKESQKCFVWETDKSSSISCPHQPEIMSKPAY
jgi:hypothetical protein